MEFDTLPRLQAPLYCPLRPEVQKRVDEVLSEVLELCDITKDHVTKVQEIIGVSMVFERFRVTPKHYRNIKGILPTGVEYDSMTRCMVLKPRGVLRDLITRIVEQWLVGVAMKIERPQLSQASQHVLVPLAEDFQGCHKHLECMIRPHEIATPIVSFELGINESTKSLLQGVTRLFRGSGRLLMLAIVLNVKELDAATEPKQDDGTAQGSTNPLAQLGKKPQPIEMRRFEATIYLTWRGSPPQHAWRCVFGSKAVYFSEPDRLFIPLRRLVPEPHMNWLTHEIVRPQYDEETEFLFPVDKLVKQMQDKIRYETSKNAGRVDVDGHKLTIKSQATILVKFHYVPMNIVR